MAVPCLCKLIFAPFILLYQSIRIYFCGCLCTYVTRFFKHLCCGLCVCCGCKFTDSRFPPNATSIGPWKGKSLRAIDQEVVWRRLGDLFEHAGHQGVQLFAGEVEAADICQGQLGDCWLLSAAACLAKYEGAIQRCFLTKEYYAYGQYSIRLFNRPTNRWVTIVIDDWIPCSRSTGQPIFAQPQGNEGWVLLVEKAFAKMRGSYGALEGGCTLEALEALTGDYCFECRYDSAKRMWYKWDLVHQARKGGKGPPQVLLQLSADKPLNSDSMFETMRLYNKRQSVIAASSGSGSDSENINGIVQGHAYAVCRVKEVEGLRLVQLRNPWGTFEWKGDWSDHSPMWQRYPKVAKVVRHEAAEDGCFWMAWDDFRRHFRNIDFCCRTTGWDDLVLDIHEECACIGPCVGCVEGCAYFWCACRGAKALFFSRDTQTDLVHKPSGCGCLP